MGARNDDQLVDTLGAVEVELSDDERSRLDRVSAPALIYPYWHQVKLAPDRLGPYDIVANEALARET